MPRSVRSMMNAGLISTKAYNATLAQTRSQKSKMVGFEAGSKDEGAGKQSGKLAVGEINQARHQKTGRFLPSKKARTVGNQSPGANQINQASMQAKKFPAGGTAKGSGVVPTPARIRGTKHQSGTM